MAWCWGCYDDVPRNKWRRGLAGYWQRVCHSCTREGRAQDVEFWSPELRLVYAVVESAISVLRSAQAGEYIPAGSDNAQSRDQCIAETVAWFRRDDDCPMSLEWCCMVLRQHGLEVHAPNVRKYAQEVLIGQN